MKILDEKIPNIEPLNYNLTDKDLSNLFCKESYIRSFVKKAGVINHLKVRNINCLINEMLGELISEYFGIESVKSILYNSNETKYKYCTLTKLFTNSNNKYAFIDTLFPNYKESRGLFNLKYLKEFNYIDTIVEMNNKDYSNLLLKLKKMIVLDYIICNVDRFFGNFIFSYDKNKVNLEPLYDFEMSFNFYEENYNIFSFDLNNEKVINYFRNDDVFQELLYRAMDLKMINIFRKFEDEYPIKLEYSDKLNYSRCIFYKQNEIKKYKLLR